MLYIQYLRAPSNPSWCNTRVRATKASTVTGTDSNTFRQSGRDAEAHATFLRVSQVLEASVRIHIASLQLDWRSCADTHTIILL